ncbi:RNase H domain-containing protein [Trichonephila clavipes]|nr:RNase H domain-containing protein [Trichonephila clavipes]
MKNIWILSVSKTIVSDKSVIQFLANLYGVGYNIEVTILKKLKQFSRPHPIRFHWISSHVDVESNENRDTLAKADASDPSISSTLITYLEFFSRVKCTQTKTLGLFHCALLVSEQTPCDNLRSLTYTDRAKSHAIYTKCTPGFASPEHILHCLRLSGQDLIANYWLILNFLRVNEALKPNLGLPICRDKQQ